MITATSDEQEGGSYEESPVYDEEPEETKEVTPNDPKEKPQLCNISMHQCIKGASAGVVRKSGTLPTYNAS